MVTYQLTVESPDGLVVTWIDVTAEQAKAIVSDEHQWRLTSDQGQTQTDNTRIRLSHFHALGPRVRLYRVVKGET